MCLEVAVWTCRAPAEPCVEPPSQLCTYAQVVPTLRRIAGVRRTPWMVLTDGELCLVFTDMIPV